MNSKQIYDSPRTFVLVFQSGDEVIQMLGEFAYSHHIAGAHFTAIGAFERCTLGYFAVERRAYEKIRLNQQIEVLSLVGNFAEENDKPKVHAHVVVGARDGIAHGGHLLEGIVRPTLEVVVTETPVHLQRRFDPDKGLALIDLTASS